MTVLDKWCFSLRCSSVLTVRQPDVLRLSRGSPGRHFLSRHSSVSARLIDERTKKVFTVILLFILSSMFWKGNHREESATSHRWQDSRKSLRPVKTSSQRVPLSETTDCLCCITDVCDSAERTDVCLDFQTLEVSKSCSAKFPHLSGRPNPVFNNASNCIIGVIWASSF